MFEKAFIEISEFNEKMRRMKKIFFQNLLKSEKIRTIMSGKNTQVKGCIENTYIYRINSA